MFGRHFGLANEKKIVVQVIESGQRLLYINKNENVL